jgi:hypothetical protein
MSISSDSDECCEEDFDGRIVTGFPERLISTAHAEASESNMLFRHGAVLFTHSGKHILAYGHNCTRSSVCGMDVPSRHAEAKCLHFLHSEKKRGRHRKGREEQDFDVWA